MTDGNYTNNDHMRNGGIREMTQADRNESQHEGAALQVVCLGSGGGPSEDNVSGFLVRSVSSGWSKGSLLAVDAGSHLAAITRVLESFFPLFSGDTARSKAANGNKLRSSASPVPKDTNQQARKQSTILDHGPFAGVKFPNESARANALHLLHTYVSTYLITHPHLDHLSGFAINTAAFHGSSKPKTMAALPGTVDAVKRHIFNDVIWPNLSDEDGGVGFVTFQRLKEGGDPKLGEGDGRGYINVCDGLGVKAFSVSHGLCTNAPATLRHRGSISNGADLAAAFNGNAMLDINASLAMSRSMSMHDHGSTPSTPGRNQRQSLHSILQPQANTSSPSCVVDSTAYFLRDEETGREVLIFGDVEPDSLSLAPRNEHVWAEAARKVANRTLKGILLECSYTDAATDEALFGHLCPRHVIAELQVLAQLVHEVKTESQRADAAGKKRKRSGLSSSESSRKNTLDDGRKRECSMHDSTTSEDHAVEPQKQRYDGGQHTNAEPEVISPRSSAARHVWDVQTLARAHQSKRSSICSAFWAEPPLRGVTVVIIHVKDTFKDGPPVSETIAEELAQYEEERSAQGNALGCKFVISQPGESYWF